jgi:class 3 adenylate cyclase
VGVHYGEAVLGAIGTGERRRLTAIGDAVNVASRVESANKAAGTSFLISQRAYQTLGDQVKTGRSVQLPLKGKTGVFLLREVTGLAPALNPAATSVHGA